MDLDLNLIGIGIVLVLIIMCIAPNTKEIIGVLTIAVNTVVLTKSLVKNNKGGYRNKEHFYNIYNMNESERNYNTLQYSMIPQARDYSGCRAFPGHTESLVHNYNLYPVNNIKFNAYSSNMFEDYPGAIDSMEAQQVPLDANHRIARLNIARQGVNATRPLAGRINKEKSLRPYLENDCFEDEHRPWWEKYDY